MNEIDKGRKVLQMQKHQTPANKCPNDEKKKYKEGPKKKMNRRELYAHV
jgi:hypothetical protein